MDYREGVLVNNRKRIYLYSKIYKSKSRSSEMIVGDNFGFNIYVASQSSITSDCQFQKQGNVIR